MPFMGGSIEWKKIVIPGSGIGEPSSYVTLPLTGTDSNGLALPPHPEMATETAISIKSLSGDIGFVATISRVSIEFSMSRNLLTEIIDHVPIIRAV
jgi:hypothetical protein